MSEQPNSLQSEWRASRDVLAIEALRKIVNEMAAVLGCRTVESSDDLDFVRLYGERLAMNLDKKERRAKRAAKTAGSGTWSN